MQANAFILYAGAMTHLYTFKVEVSTTSDFSSNVATPVDYSGEFGHVHDGIICFIRSTQQVDIDITE
jgi:hypothetical protein